MAEGGSPQAKDLVCSHFLWDACQKGASCKYEHNRESKMPRDNVCRSYQFGKCAFGRTCQYDHVKKEDTPDIVAIRRMALAAQTPEEDDSEETGGLDPIKESEIEKLRQKKWAKAKAFVPGRTFNLSRRVSYDSHAEWVIAQNLARIPRLEPTCVGDTVGEALWDEPRRDWVRSGSGGLPLARIKLSTPMCPQYERGFCPRGSRCKQAHGDLCDICGLPRLHPQNAYLRQKHVRKCLAEYHQDMADSAAYEASKDKECGICLENVLEKKSPLRLSGEVDRRFGLLENCNHSFCWPCLQVWRGSEDKATQAQRSCPMCRTPSDFILPSKYWCGTQEEKDEVIKDYKRGLQHQPCEFFDEGEGQCPFGEKCFYLHALPNGVVLKKQPIHVAQLTRRRGIVLDTGIVQDVFVSRFLGEDMSPITRVYAPVSVERMVHPNEVTFYSLVSGEARRWSWSERRWLSVNVDGRDSGDNTHANNLTVG